MDTKRNEEGLYYRNMFRGVPAFNTRYHSFEIKTKSFKARQSKHVIHAYKLL